MAKRPYDEAIAGLRLFAERIIPEIEREWGCVIEIDHAILDESAIKACETIDHVPKASPNELKQASHFAFWLRKLKPLRVINLNSLQRSIDQLNTDGLIVGKISSVQSIYVPDASRYLFVNELFAIYVASGICRQADHEISLTAATINDLAVSLRYNSFSPSAISAILTAHLDR